MSTDIETIAPGATIAEARELMRRRGIRHLLVRDARRIVGVVSDRDLGGRAGALNGVNRVRSVAEVMSSKVATASPSTTIRQAANLLRGRSIGCLPVVDGGTPVGIVTTTDVLELVGRGVERPVERSTPWTLRGRGNRGASASARSARRG